MVTATSPLTSTGPLTNTSGLSVTITQNPSLVFAKSAAPQSGTLTPGQSITYTMVVTTDGNVTLSNVSSPTPCRFVAIELQPADHPDPAQATPVRQPILSHNLMWMPGRLSTARSFLRPALLAPTSPLTETSGVTITAIQTPSIQMVKKRHSEQRSHQPWRDYQLHAGGGTNSGNVTLRNVVITDSLPGLSPLSCSQPITPTRQTTSVPPPMLSRSLTWIVGRSPTAH